MKAMRLKVPIFGVGRSLNVFSTMKIGWLKISMNADSQEGLKMKLIYYSICCRLKKQVIL